MATATDDSRNSGDKPDSPISPAKRRMLQQIFEHANKTSAEAARKGVASSYDYANDQYTQCVLGDPSNIVYLQALFANLYKKHKLKKKGGGWLAGRKGSSERATIKKATSKKKWDEVFKPALKLLKDDPFDATALLPLAEACEKLRYYDAQLVYLKGAFAGNAKNAQVNRVCGEALARRGRYDDAIECWRRVKEADPNDDNAEQMIAKLAVDKTIRHGKYDEAESTTDAMADKQAQAERRGEADRVSPEQKFRKLIEEQPTELGHYLELAEILRRDDRHDEVEKTLQKALEVSGGDLRVREQLEDAQIARLKQNFRIAERTAKDQPSDEANQLVKQLAAELNRAEIDVFASRETRYPSNTGLKYELGLRLKRAGNYAEAIKHLQQARSDPKHKGMAHLELGECFRCLKQYPLAMSAYETALESIPPRDAQHRKLAHYWAGKIALLAIKDVEKAEKHLNELGSIDFAYKDLQALLDKLSQVRDNA